MTVRALQARDGKRAGNQDLRGDSPFLQVTHSLTSEGHDASEDGTGRGTPLVAAPITTATHHSRGGGENDVNLVNGISAVRRLTPIECCRLQGFPDDWLGGNEPPDSPKYAALGDAVTVPVAEWIGRRLVA